MKEEHVELVKGVGVLAFGSLYSNLVMDTVLHTMEGRFPQDWSQLQHDSDYFRITWSFFILYEYSYYFSNEFLYRRQVALVKRSWGQRNVQQWLHGMQEG